MNNTTRSFADPYDDFRDFRDISADPTAEASSVPSAVPLAWNDFTPDDEKRAKKVFSRYFLALSLFLLAANLSANLIVLALGIFGAGSIPFYGTSVFTLLLNAVCMYGFGLCAFYPIVHSMRRVDEVGSSISFKEFLVFFCVAQAFMLGGSLIGQWLNGMIETVLSVFTGIDWTIGYDVGELLEEAPVWITIPIVAILGPIVEELLFRKLMIDRFSVYGDRIAIIVSAVAFGLFHGNFYQLFYAAFLGLILGYMYTKTRNILYPVLLHISINLLSTLASWLVLPHAEKAETAYEQLIADALAVGEIPIGDYLTDILITGAYSMFYYGVVIAGVILFFVMKKRIFVSDRCEVAIPKGKRLSTVLVNFGAILFTFIAALEILLNILTPLFDAVVK